MRKLSDIHGEEAMDLIAILIDVGRKITTDKGMKKYFTGAIPKGMTSAEFSDDFTGDFFKILLGKYRKDCVKMLAMVEGISEEEYLKDADIMKISADLGSLTSDKVFNDLFFVSAQSRMSGSASENTKVQK